MGGVEIAGLVLLVSNFVLIVAALSLVGYYYKDIASFLKNQEYVVCCVKHMCALVPGKDSPCGVAPPDDEA